MIHELIPLCIGFKKNSNYSELAPLMQMKAPSGDTLNIYRDYID